MRPVPHYGTYRSLAVWGRKRAALTVFPPHGGIIGVAAPCKAALSEGQGRASPALFFVSGGNIVTIEPSVRYPELT